MKVYAEIRREVEIDPRDVIQKLIYGMIGTGWVYEKDGKYYEAYEVSAGPHSIEREGEITKETYDYVMALKFILEHIEDGL